MELYIIRHGQSTNNALNSAVGRSKDPGLTETGMRQAEALAAHLADGDCPETHYEKRTGYNLDTLYCSAMQRAMLTAQPVAAALGLKPQVWVETHEQGGIYLDNDNGERIGYSGMTRGEILERFPDYVLPDAITDAGWWNHGYESLGGATGRAVAVAEILIERARHSSERLGLISHGMFVNLLIKALFNQLPTPTSYFQHYNTGISRIDIRPDGFVILRYFNRISHLPPDLITY